MRECGCRGCLAAACASGPTVLRSCTGANIVRTRLEASGTLGGSASNDSQINFNAGDFCRQTSSGTWSASFNIAAIVEAVTPLAAGFTGESTTYSDFPLNNVDTISPFGTMTGSASASFTLTDIDTNESLGGGTLTLDSTSCTLSVGIAVDGSGVVTVNVTAGFGAGFSAPNPLYPARDPENPRIGYSIGGSIVATYTGTSVLDALCNPVTVTATTNTSLEGGSSITPTYVESEDDAVRESDWDGGASVTATRVDQTGKTDEDDPLTAIQCARFYDFTGTTLDRFHSEGETAEDLVTTPVYADVTGRLVMGTVARCGGYFPIWGGPGTYTYTDEEDNEVVLDVTLRAEIIKIGPEYVIGMLFIMVGETVKRLLPFKLPAPCLDSDTPQIINYPDTPPIIVLSDLYTETLSFAPSERIPGDPSYYCDCDSRACTTSPSSLAAVWDSVIGAMSEAVIVPKTSSDPCTYETTFSPASIGNGDIFSVKLESLATKYWMTVKDDEGSVILVAEASCKSAPIEDAVWKVTKLAGAYATTPAMTDMTVSVG